MEDDLTAFNETQEAPADDLTAFDLPTVVQAIQSERQTKMTADLDAIRRSATTGSIETFDNLSRANQDLIRQGNEIYLRNEATLEKRRRMKEEVQGLQVSALQMGDVLTADELVTYEEQLPDISQAYNDLEAEAVDIMQNLYLAENPDFAMEVARREIAEEDNTFQLIKENITKHLIFQREYDRALSKLEDRESLGRTVSDWAGILLIPFADAKASLGKFEGDTPRGLFTTAGARENDEIISFWNLPVEEFASAAPGLIDNLTENSGFFGGTNDTLARQNLEKWYSGSLTGTERLLSTASFGLDSAVGVGAIASTAKRVGNLAGVAKATGNRPLAVRTHLKDALDPDADKGDLAEALLPKAMKPQTADVVDDMSVDLSLELSTKLDEMNALAEQAKSLTARERLTPDEVGELIDRQFRSFQSRTGLKPASFEILTDQTTNINTLRLHIGKAGDNAAYASEKSARTAATRRGIQDYQITEDASGFWITATETVAEETPTGLTLLKRPQAEETVFPKAGPIKAFLKKPDDLVPSMHSQMRHLAEMDQVALREQIVKPLSKPITRLKKDEVKALNTVMTSGQQKNKWFKLPEFAAEWKKATGSYPTEAQTEAYYAAKALNDVDYAIHNNKLYTDLAKRGFRSVTINNPRTKFKFDGIATEIKDPDIKSMRVFDVSESKAFSPKKNTPEDIANLERKMASGEYRVVRLRDPIKFRGDPIHVALVHNSAMTSAPLKRNVLAYKGGGHTMYRTKWFAKQANRGKYTDGEEFLGSPHTMSTFRTAGEGKKWVEEVNAALRVYRQYKIDLEEGVNVDAQAVAAIIADSPFEDIKRLEKMVSDGEINLLEDVEVVYDKGLPSAYNGAEDGLWRMEMDDVDSTGDWAFSTGRLYYGRRGEGLSSPLEYKDVVVDPLDALNKGIEHAIRLQAFGPYFQRAIDDWVRVASPYFDNVKSGRLSGSTSQAFYNGVLSENLKVNNPKLYKSLNTNRQIIKETMGMPTPTQEAFAAGKRSLAAFVENTGGEFGTFAVKKAEDIFDKNPVNAINALVFDAWLGMFDVSQLVVQTQTALAAVTLAPKRGAQAMTMLPAFRWALVNRSDNLLDYIAKNGVKLHGQTPEDFKDMVRSFEKSGWNDVGGEIMFISNHANGIGNPVSSNTIKAVREKGRMFFNEAERVNRIVAWQIAWKEAREALPNVATTSDEFARYVSQRTSDYSQNMTQISNGQIQNGVWSIPTRFLGYQMRLLENMLPKGMGGTSSFTADQKVRLALGQVLFYGAAGLPTGSAIASFIREKHKDATGEDLSLEQAKLLESGAIDSILYAISGGELNTDFADRAGSGRGWDDLWTRLSTGRLSSFLDVALGPTGSFGVGYAESVSRVMRYFHGEQLGTITQEDAEFVFNELVVNHVSSLRRGTKAAWIYRMGNVVDSKSGRPLYDATKLEAIAAGLGIPLWEDSERGRLYKLNLDIDEEVRDVSKQIAQIRRKAFTALSEGDDKKYEALAKQARVMLSAYDNDPFLQQRILQATDNELGYQGNFYNNLVEEIHKKTGVRPATEEPIKE